MKTNISEAIMETELGLFKIISEKGFVETFVVDEELNLDFKITGLENGSNTTVNISLPIKIPEGIHFYLWKNINDQILKVPYELSENRDTISIFLKDGVIDDDGLINGEISDPLQLLLPKYEVNITKNNKTAKVEIKEQETKELSIETKEGKLDQVQVINPENIPRIPVKAERFEHKMLKFNITNITNNSTEVYLSYDNLPKKFKLWKFNPNKIEWYEFPFERVNSTTIKIILIDGGIGDDDGLKNGVIEDDLGLVIIPVTKASHLDENKEIIEDIYDEVKALDGNWSPTIENGEYVRVTFETNLTSENDITIYPRTINGSPRIEVYENNKTELIAEFENISDNTYNKVYLTGLNTSQDIFDLKILNGSVEFDYIVDPWPNATFEKCINITITNVGSSNLTNFPAYINLSKDVDMLSDYSDLRFYNSSCNEDGTLLNHEIENYTASNAYIWVRIPKLLNGNNTISVYFKNSSGVTSVGIQVGSIEKR